VYLENLKRITHYDEEEEQFNKVEKEANYQKSKICYYCENHYFVEELNKKLTLKMVLQMDKHLQIRGKTYDW